MSGFHVSCCRANTARLGRKTGNGKYSPYIEPVRSAEGRQTATNTCYNAGVLAKDARILAQLSTHRYGLYTWVQVLMSNVLSKLGHSFLPTLEPR